MGPSIVKAGPLDRSCDFLDIGQLDSTILVYLLRDKVNLRQSLTFSANNYDKPFQHN